MKKEYKTPELEKFGILSELSAGGSVGAVEGVDSQNNPARARP